MTHPLELAAKTLIDDSVARVQEQEQTPDLAELYVEDVETSPAGRRLHNSPRGSYAEVQTEKPWHRFAMHALSLGRTPAEVAQICGCAINTVRGLIKQPWFQEKLNALMAGQSQTVYSAVIAGEDVNSLLCLMELRDNKETPPAVRKACASDILDRIHGKATQVVESHVTHKTISDDPNKLDEELAKLEAQEKALLGAGGG